MRSSHQIRYGANLDCLICGRLASEGIQLAFQAELCVHRISSSLLRRVCRVWLEEAQMSRQVANRGPCLIACKIETLHSSLHAPNHLSTLCLPALPGLAANGCPDGIRAGPWRPPCQPGDWQLWIDGSSQLTLPPARPARQPGECCRRGIRRQLGGGASALWLQAWWRRASGI